MALDCRNNCGLSGLMTCPICNSILLVKQGILLIQESTLFIRKCVSPLLRSETFFFNFQLSFPIIQFYCFFNIIVGS